MNGSVAAEQTPHLSHRDVHGFKIESFNPQLLKEEERKGGSEVELAKEEGRKDKAGKGDSGAHNAGRGAQSSGSDWVYVRFDA